LHDMGCSGPSKFQVTFQLKCWMIQLRWRLFARLVYYVSYWAIFTPLNCRYVVSSGAVLALVASLIGGILPQVYLWTKALSNSPFHFSYFLLLLALSQRNAKDTVLKCAGVNAFKSTYRP
jgi:hypothetical protein